MEIHELSLLVIFEVKVYGLIIKIGGSAKPNHRIKLLYLSLAEVGVCHFDYCLLLQALREIENGHTCVSLAPTTE